jgi:hypothetical protein
LPDTPTRPHAEFVTFDWPAADLAADPDLAAESIFAALDILRDHRVSLVYVGPGYESPSQVWSITGPDLVTAADSLDVDIIR